MSDYDFSERDHDELINAQDSLANEIMAIDERLKKIEETIKDLSAVIDRQSTWNDMAADLFRTIVEQQKRIKGEIENVTKTENNAEN